MDNRTKISWESLVSEGFKPDLTHPFPYFIHKNNKVVSVHKGGIFEGYGVYENTADGTILGLLKKVEYIDELIEFYK